MPSEKSCANCKFIAESTVMFPGGQSEDRVICAKSCWPKGSIVSRQLYIHPGRFKEKAEKCRLYTALGIVK
jgi:hypothetical protein